MSTRKFEDDDKEYITTTKTRVLNGKTYTINNRHPVLEPEERERRHQEFLKVADRILQKHNVN